LNSLDQMGKYLKLDKKYIANKIYIRLNKTIPRIVILDIINIIYDFIVDNLKHNNAFSVKNFGTFIPYIFRGHPGFNVSSGKVEEVKPFKTVKFLPHVELTKLVKLNRNKLLKKN